MRGEITAEGAIETTTKIIKANENVRDRKLTRVGAFIKQEEQHIVTMFLNGEKPEAPDNETALPHGEISPPLIRAVENKDLPMVRLLLSVGAKVDNNLLQWFWQNRKEQAQDMLLYLLTFWMNNTLPLYIKATHENRFSPIIARAITANSCILWTNDSIPNSNPKISCLLQRNSELFDNNLVRLISKNIPLSIEEIALLNAQITTYNPEPTCREKIIKAFTNVIDNVSEQYLPLELFNLIADFSIGREGIIITAKEEIKKCVRSHILSTCQSSTAEIKPANLEIQEECINRYLREVYFEHVIRDIETPQKSRCNIM